jgi:bifunctional DNase/RNase
MIPVKVDQVFLSNAGFVVILRNERDPRALPIFIGQAEAESIMLRLNNVSVPRPLTHDLLKNLLDYLECRLARIEICDLKEGVFYARLILMVDDRELEVDARPSDAIALALRVDAPLLVDERVMDEAGRIVQIEDKTVEGTQEPRSARNVQPAKPASPADVLSSSLSKAVAEERYEEAARIRDEIKKLKDSHAGN